MIVLLFPLSERKPADFFVGVPQQLAADEYEPRKVDYWVFVFVDDAFFGLSSFVD